LANQASKGQTLPARETAIAQGLWTKDVPAALGYALIDRLLGEAVILCVRMSTHLRATTLARHLQNALRDMGLRGRG